jgi:hypothetical protein
MAATFASLRYRNYRVWFVAALTAITVRPHIHRPFVEVLSSRTGFDGTLAGGPVR